MLNVDGLPASAPPLYDAVLPETAGPSTSISCIFPHLPASVWTWAHDGTKPNGIIEFTPDGGAKWFNGKRQGYWKLEAGGTVLETEFNGVYHELEYVAGEKKAVLRKPKRSPPSQMWIQGNRGTCGAGM